MKKKVLVTGSAGFIFSNFMRIANLKKDEFRWSSLDNLSITHSLKNVYVNSGHEFYIADVSDKAVLSKIFQKELPDIVIHGAASSHVDESIESASPFITTNVIGTQNIIDLCLEHQVERLVYISTDEVYGHLVNEDLPPWKEDAPLSPRNPYSASKASGELLVQAAHQTHGLQYNITRSCNNMGPRQSIRNLVPKTIRCIINNDKIPIYGQGLQCREWIHVADNCYAILKIIQDGIPNEIYNISTGYELNNLELVNKICNTLEKGHDLIHFVEDRKGHDFRYSVDNSKIKSIGWEPKFSFSKALNMTISWYINNRWFLDLTS